MVNVITALHLSGQCSLVIDVIGAIHFMVEVTAAIHLSDRCQFYTFSGHVHVSEGMGNSLCSLRSERKSQSIRKEE